MCNLLRCFKGELEVFWRGGFPGFDRFCVRHPVKRVIDLDAVQTAGVIPQELFVGNIGRIKRRLPFLVAETRRAEPNPRHSGIIAHKYSGTLVIIGRAKWELKNCRETGRF